MLVDVGAIAGSLVAIHLAARPETGSHTYGMKRAEILAAAGNAIALLVVSALVTSGRSCACCTRRPVDGAVLIVVAGVGVAVNVVATLIMSRAEPAFAQHRGGLPAHPHRPLRLRRHR